MGSQKLDRMKKMLFISTVVFCVILIAAETVSAQSGFATGGVSGGSGGASGGASGGGSSGPAYGGVSYGSAGARGGSSGGGSAGVATGGVSGGSGGASGGASGGGSSGPAYGGVSGVGGGYYPYYPGDYYPRGGIHRGCYLVCDRWKFPDDCDNNEVSCNTLVCSHWSWICR